MKMIDPKCAKCKQKYCHEGITDESLLPAFCPVKNFKVLIQEVTEKYSTEEIHHFERFLAEYESRFEREYGSIRPVVKEVTERIINHLKLTFVADKPPPPYMAYQKLLMAPEAGNSYLSLPVQPSKAIINNRQLGLIW